VKGIGYGRKGDSIGESEEQGFKGAAEIACFLSREMGIPMAEIARRLGVGTSAIAMAIGRKYCIPRNVHVAPGCPSNCNIASLPSRPPQGIFGVRRSFPWAFSKKSADSKH